MILIKKFDSKEVLEIVAERVSTTVPKDFDGTLTAVYNDNDEIEVHLVSDNETAGANTIN